MTAEWVAQSGRIAAPQRGGARTVSVRSARNREAYVTRGWGHGAGARRARHIDAAWVSTRCCAEGGASPARILLAHIMCCRRAHAVSIWAYRVRGRLRFGAHLRHRTARPRPGGNAHPCPGGVRLALPPDADQGDAFHGKQPREARVRRRGHPCVRACDDPPHATHAAPSRQCTGVPLSRASEPDRVAQRSAAHTVAATRAGVLCASEHHAWQTAAGWRGEAGRGDVGGSGGRLG